MDYVQVIIWDPKLNMAKVEFQLIKDADNYLFYEKGMRDRLSYIIHSYSLRATKQES